MALKPSIILSFLNKFRYFEAWKSRICTEKFDKIFEIFQRLHSRSAYEGTGIGLALCARIVANHHGLITAEGKAGAGATFEIILPARQP